MTSETSGASGSRTISRRTLMRAGTTVAWSVPLVQVVTAGPAAASVVTPPAGTIVLTPSGTGSWSTIPTGNGNSTTPVLPVSATVKNTGNTTTSQLQLTFSFPSGWAPKLQTAPSGWSTTQAPGTGSQTWTFVASAQVGPGVTSAACAPVFQATKSSNDNKAVKITLTAQSKFGTSGTVTGSGLIDVAAK